MCRPCHAINFLVIKKHRLLNYICNSAGCASLLRAAVTGQQGEERTHHSEQLIPALSQVNVPLGTPGITLFTYSVADPDPRSGAFLTLDPVSGIGFFRIPNLGSRSNFLGKKYYCIILCNLLQFFFSVPYQFKNIIIYKLCDICGYKKGRTNFSPFSFVDVVGCGIRDPGWIKIRIRDPR